MKDKHQTFNEKRPTLGWRIPTHQVELVEQVKAELKLNNQELLQRAMDFYLTSLSKNR
jgi:hypothetical protein